MENLCPKERKALRTAQTCDLGRETAQSLISTAVSNLKKYGVFAFPDMNVVQYLSPTFCKMKKSKRGNDKNDL